MATRSAEQQQFTQAQLADFQQAQAQQKASWVQTDSQNFTSIAHTIVTDLESGAGWVWGHMTGWFGSTVSWVENHPLNAALTGASLTPIAGNFIAATDDAFHGHWGWALVDVGFVALDCDGMGEAEAAARVLEESGQSIVSRVAQQVANRGVGALRAAMSEAQRLAFDANPAGGSRFLGTMVHELTDVGLRNLYGERFRYYRVGPDFLDRETGELIELTTPAQVAAHQAKPGYEYLTYALYNLPPIP